jgi:multiple sugar transport system permease protein
MTTPRAASAATPGSTIERPRVVEMVTAREPRTRYRDLDAQTKRYIKGAVVTLFATTVLAAYLLPLLFMATTSLKTEDQIANGRVLPSSPLTAEIDGEEHTVYDVEIDGELRSLAILRPGRQESVLVDPAEPDVEIVWEGNWRLLEPTYEVDPGFANFPEAWRVTTPPMDRMLLNTFIIAGLGMGGTVISSTLVAYGLSRFRFPAKNLILVSLLATIILPRFVTLIPTYIMWRWVGAVGTFFPLIVPHFFSNAYNVFLMRQFFLTIPKDLDEAAAIDGAGPIRTLLTVILPQAKGAVLAIGLFHFFFAWNDFFEPLVFLISAREKLPISVGLYQFLGIYDTNIPLVLAGALIAMAFPLLVFVSLQRVFLRGIDLSGSLK